jgi:hypothetical protein
VAVRQPELMMPAADITPLPTVATSSDDNVAPVDKTLMQRGFSHAFDQLLQPAGSGL